MRRNVWHWLMTQGSGKEWQDEQTRVMGTRRVLSECSRER